MNEPMQYRRNKYKVMSEPFQPYVKDYINTIDLNNDLKNYTPFIIGKIVIVDVVSDDKSLEEVIWKQVIPTNHIKEGPSQRINGCEYFKLPLDLRATTPKDVETIILLKWKRLTVGKYGKPHYIRARGREIELPLATSCRIECEVMVIDKTTKTIVDRKIFHGGDPPKSIRMESDSDYGPHFGSRPTKQIVDYIASLPRKNHKSDSID